MQRIDGFSLYQKHLQEQTGVRRSKPAGAEKAGKAGMPEPVDTYERSSRTDKITEQPELSEAAQNLLDELKEKYADMDFFVADYASDEEADRILARGTKEYSVLIDPETLEAMAADQATKDKYTALIDEATASFEDMKEELGDDADNVERISVTLQPDGTMKYFAHLSKMSENQRERIEETKEADRKKAEEAREGEARKMSDARPSYKATTVSADSLEELIKAIKTVDWSEIEEIHPPVVGGRFDFSI